MTGRLTRRGFAMAFSGALAARAAGPWIPLVQGNGLAGWKTTGAADWKVEDGAIVGRQGAGGAAGDLFSERQFRNFELECEWRMRYPGNSGIWFRVGKPRTGYQADFLDQPSHPGVLAGSLYCMGKAFIAENRDTSTVKRQDWNTLRVRAEGDHIEIVLNGRKVVDIRDSSWPDAGSVGIQIHAGAQFDGMEVRVRKFRIREL
jgi:hypothetical protein